jgi:hypothetical protein
VDALPDIEEGDKNKSVENLRSLFLSHLLGVDQHLMLNVKEDKMLGSLLAQTTTLLEPFRKALEVGGFDK